MKLRGLGLTVVLALLIAPLAVEAEQGAKLPRIGYLAAAIGPGTAASDAVELFRQGLREHGWIEGQNVVIEVRRANRLDRLPDAAAELVRLKVDVICAQGTAAAVAAHNATRTIPIVMGLVGNPVGLGIVASLARPGGNVTGLSAMVGYEIVGKRLELLKAAVPTVSRVAVLGDPGEPYWAANLRELEVAGRSLGVQLQVLEARGLNEFDSAFATMVRQRAGALYIVPGNVSVQYGRLAELAAKNRLPAIHGWREFVDAGGLMSYGANLPDLYRRAAGYVDKILKGAKPADLPVEQPTKFELVINLKTAKALGLTIPPSLLLRADQVIE